MDKHLHTPITPLTISETASISELVANMAGTSFQARNLGLAADIWSRMLEGRVAIFLGLAGAMIPAGMRKVMAYLIQNRLIDCLVSTGANLFHDLHETLGRYHYQGSPFVDDKELRRMGIDRIYDTFMSEEEFCAGEDFITDFAASLDQGRVYTTREFFHLLGKRLSSEGKEEGILISAAKAGIPVYCPALADSAYGIAIAAGRAQHKNNLYFDVIKDIIEMAQIIDSSSATGVVYLGGGTPKNFIQQAEVCGHLLGKEFPGHKYAVQITSDSPQWGGLSGCTFEEAQSWGKVDAEARMITVNCDATIALPILVSALAQRCAQAIQKRVKPTFRWDGEFSISWPK